MAKASDLILIAGLLLLMKEVRGIGSGIAGAVPDFSFDLGNWFGGTKDTSTPSERGDPIAPTETDIAAPGSVFNTVLQGFIYDGWNNEPIQTANITVDGWYKTLSKSDGSYYIPLPSGHHYITVQTGSKEVGVTAITSTDPYLSIKDIYV